MLIKNLGLYFIGILFCAEVFALRVVTTTQDFASLVEQIGKDKVDVSYIAKGTQDPHFLEAKPSQMVKLNRADLVIAAGLQLEGGWLPLLLQGARRPDIIPGRPGYMEAAQAITPIDVNANADRSQGDVHPQGNPHFSADPERILAVSELISKKLAELDPTNAATYKANQETFSKLLKAKIVEWKKRLAPLRGVKVVGFHQTFNYFFRFFGMDGVGYIEPKPGIPPTAQHVLQLVDLAKKEKVKLIVTESYFDPKPGQTIAEKTGAHAVVLPAYVGGDETSTDYITWYENLVSGVEKGMGLSNSKH